MSRSNKAAVNMVTNAGGFIAPLMVNFIVTPILLKFIGEAAYGLQSLALVVSGYLAIMDLGMDIPITKFLAEDHAKQDHNSANVLLNTTLLLYLIISVCGGLIIFASKGYLVDKFFLIPDDQKANAAIVFQLAAAGFTLNIMSSWGRACLHGLQRYDVTNSIRIVTMIASSVIGIIVVYLGYGLVGFVLVRVIGYAVSATLCIYMANRLLPYFKISLKISKNALRRISGYVGMGLVLRGSGFIIMGLDRTLLGTMVGVSVVAVYSIQWSIITPTVGLMNSIFAFFFPMASELHGSGKIDELKDIFKRTSKFMAGAIFLVFPLLLIYGDVFLRLWIGDSVANSARYLLPMLIIYSMISNLALGLINEVAGGTGKLRSFLCYTLSKSFVLAASLFIFIKIFGLVGTGFAYLTLSIVDLSFFLFFLKRHLHIPLGELLRHSYLHPFLISLSICTVGILLKPYVNGWFMLVAVLALLTASYILLGFKFSVFGETEKMAMYHFGRIILKPLRRNEI